MTLTSELEALRDQFGWGDRDVAGLNLAAIEASFAPDATKRRLREATGAWLAA
jgi:adenosine deaminase